MLRLNLNPEVDVSRIGSGVPVGTSSRQSDSRFFRNCLGGFEWS